MFWKKYRNYIILAIIALILLFSRRFAVIVTDIQWFQALDFFELFWKPIAIQYLFSIIAFILGAVFIYLNLGLLINNLITPEYETKFYETGLAEYADVITSMGKIGRLIISIIISFIWIGSFANIWENIVYVIGSQSTGIVDPIFNIDAVFYLFHLPFLQRLVSPILALLILTIIAVSIIYFSKGLLSWTIFRKYSPLQAPALKHLNYLLSGIFLILTFRFILSLFNLMFSPRGAVYGIGFTDLYISAPVYIILALLSIASLVLTLGNFKWKKYRLSLYCFGGIIAVSILGGIVATAVQSIVVAPNELTREGPFINNHLEMTQKAYGIDDITERTWEIEDNENGTENTIENNVNEDEANQIEEDLDQEEGVPQEEDDAPQEEGSPQEEGVAAPEIIPEVINNVRLLDYRPLRDVYREAQEYRRYYHFNDVDIARYTIDDQYHQVMLAAREMDVDRLPTGAQTAVNRHLKYTHGYGLAMSPVGDLTPDGLPRYFFQDMPVQDHLDMGLERPELYFGELTNDFVIVNSEETEFHYPGQEDVELIYEGESGINMHFMNRLLFALRKFNSFILFSGEFSSESQILFNRNIKERVERIAPFLRYDQDPYLAVADDRLYWIMDAYVETNQFPYSQPFEDSTNYIRNPVKVVIDAYSGTVDFYLIEDDEPFTQALDRAFPDLFSNLDELSKELRAQFRYPEDLFSAQAHILQNYHMENPVIFYNREDAWDIPTENYQNETITMEPYYATLNLGEEERPEFVLMIPYTPVERNNMISWLGARNDGENYGELVLFRFPSGEHIYGPQQIEFRIDQDPQISQQISLWDTRGSRVIRGNLLVIPLENGILYIEPLYLQAEASSFPEMRRVLSFWQGDLVMADTLDEALAMHGVDPEELDLEDPDDIEDIEEIEDLPDTDIAGLDQLSQEALDLYRQADEALRQGNWTEYGATIEELEGVLEEIQLRVDENF